MISNLDQQVDKKKYGDEHDRIFGNHRHQFCPRCGQPIPGLQAGEICEHCVKEEEKDGKEQKSSQGAIGISGPEFEKEFDLMAKLNSRRTT